MSNTLAGYTQEVEDEVGRTIVSDDGARNLCSKYVQKALNIIYAAHPWLWILKPEGEASNDIAIVANDHLKTLPTDLLDIRNCRLIDSGQSRWVMTPRPIDWLDRRFPDVTLLVAGYPEVYSRVGQSQIKFAPKSSGSYTLRLRYTVMPVALTGAVVSLVPSQYDLLVVECATALGFNRLRMFKERDARMDTFKSGLQVAIAEDRDESQVEYVMSPYAGPGATHHQIMTGQFWNQPDIRSVQ